MQLVVLESWNTNGSLDINALKSNIEKDANGATHNNATTFPLTVTYTVTENVYEIDDKGNVKLAVLGPEVTHTISPEGGTDNETVTITINSTALEGTIVSKITKPDGTSVNNSTSTTYEVTSNGRYTFIVEASDGGKTKYDVEITNSKEVEKFSDIYETTTKITSSDGKEVWVPGGFAVGVTNLVNNVSKGLVITDSINPDHTSNGNEFVWIPVDDPSDMYGVLADGTKIGKLYTNFSGTGTTATSSALNWENDTANSGKIKWTNATGYREPDILNNSNYDNKTEYLKILNDILGTNFTSNGTTITTSFKKYLQNEFDKMIESVDTKNYKGFYVGRYEIKVEQTTENEKIKYIVKSKKGETSTTDADKYDGTITNKWYGLYAEQQLFSTNFVQGQMIWGCQYDQMMKWMQKNNINVASSTPINGAARNNGNSGLSAGTTGTVETDKLNNVYDLLGNAFEWTNESQNSDSRTYRSGYYEAEVNLCTRPVGLKANNDDNYCTSRLTLYVK